MKKLISYFRQPTTLQGLACFVFTAFAAYHHILDDGTLEAIVAAACMLLIPEDKQTQAVLENVMNKAIEGVNDKK